MMHDEDKYDNTKLSFRAEHSVAKNLGIINVNVHEILRRFAPLNDNYNNVKPNDNLKQN